MTELTHKTLPLLSYFITPTSKFPTDEIRLLINFVGDHKSDHLINECLCGNIFQYKKILSEIYLNTINQI